MNGQEIVSKLHGSHLTQAHIFGVPLTTDILIEVICNGWTSDDKNVSQVKSSQSEELKLSNFHVNGRK